MTTLCEKSNYRAETLDRSRHHARTRATLRHCVALVRWNHGEYSTHYEVTRDHADRHPGGTPTGEPLTYYHQGDYYATEAAAREGFSERAREFESRWWKFLERDGYDGRADY